MMADSVQLFPVSDEVVAKHERVLVKQIMHIWSEAELMQGSLEESPKKSVDVPNYTGSEKTRNELSLAYRMVVTDPLGEKKVSPTGELREGRKYLCETFKTGDSPNLLVLVSHLMRVIQYEGSEDSFLATYNQLLPMMATPELRDLLVEKGFAGKFEGELKYVSMRSAFVQFGAELVASGMRVFDDYWEVVAKKQGLTPHHRVFKLSLRLIETLKMLKPQIFLTSSHQDEKFSAPSNRVFEPSYLTVTEQTSAELREQYGREVSNGEHIDVVVPGQSINGSLELSALFKIPKYHNKNSFQQATQMKALDSPIGLQAQTTNLESSAGPQVQFSGAVQPASKPNKRMLNSILDGGPIAKTKTAEEQDERQHALVSFDEDLHINGWKFDSLPLKTPGDESSQRSLKGLPLYEKERLISTLQKLTPNQIREVEHMHDSVYLNLGLQNVRKIRSKKWSKYWQYKAGVPIGLMSNEVDYYKQRYVKEVLEQSSSVTNYNPETNVDETHITVRKPKANYMGYSNIRGFKPPYASKP